jgi:hypothetical protein
MAIKAKNFLSKVFPTILFLFFGIFLIFSTAKASSHYTTIWGSHYSYSGTYEASCYICHSLNLEHLNAYGRDVCLTEAEDLEGRLVAIEMYDSDGDGTTNLTEINLNAQPGWTEGDNRLYHSDTCLDALVNIPVPSPVPRPYDPELNFLIFLPVITNTIH